MSRYPRPLHLDAGAASLDRVLLALKRYRASVLKAAVTGRLTEEWREEHPDVEPASVLLERILDERLQRLEEEQLRRSQVKKSRPPEGWQENHMVESPAERDGLPSLPPTWAWSTIGQCFKVAVGATPRRSEPDYWAGSIPWVSSGEVQFCRISETKEHITELGLSKTSTQVNPAGSVMLGMIGEGRTRGQAAILDMPAANNQNCAAIWVSETSVLSDFVYYWLCSRYQETRGEGSGNNQPALNKRLVQAIPLPLPPLTEQREIVQQVGRALALTSRVEVAVTASRKRSARLRHVVLRRAFEGRLVPQVTSDEPASVLLERIVAARDRNGEPTTRGRASRKGTRVLQQHRP